MDARRRRLSPVVVVAAFLFFPLFFGSQPAAAYGKASGAGGMTALQKHAAFFDKDNDGFVSPTETYDGLRVFSPHFILSWLHASQGYAPSDLELASPA
ncbi:hypothetical protein OsI_08837 [Oryza sativa Indica Group]|uniref:EF-hand domain-containing protein n=1 Tax=Oryza sativa subsp. indica TaxID=39946 RepID=A2X9B9_ORYSI|nr:hypothetical protein OsI_08837 [Oryza sativa Indica Group]